MEVNTDNSVAIREEERSAAGEPRDCSACLEEHKDVCCLRASNPQTVPHSISMLMRTQLVEVDDSPVCEDCIKKIFGNCGKTEHFTVTAAPGSAGAFCRLES